MPAVLRFSHHTSCITRHALHLTPHTSHLTPHTSHLTPHTSHLTPHTSHLTPQTRRNAEPLSFPPLSPQLLTRGARTDLKNRFGICYARRVWRNVYQRVTLPQVRLRMTQRSSESMKLFSIGGSIRRPFHFQPYSIVVALLKLSLFCIMLSHCRI